MSGPSESGGGGASEASQGVAGDDLDDAEALFWRAICYRDEEGVPQDDTEAARLWRLAAERGHAGAQCVLGDSYTTGAGVLPDDDEAARWFRLAAEQGDARRSVIWAIATTLGRACRRTTRLQPATTSSQHARYAGAQCSLGRCFAEGRGRPQDDDEAARLYRQAADQGDTGGQRLLANCYLEGKGVPRDDN